MALACLALALQPRIEALAAGVCRRLPGKQLAGQGCVFLLAAAILLRQNQLVLPQLTVLGFSDSEFTDRRTQRAEAQEVIRYLSDDDRVFFVSQGDDGMDWLPLSLISTRLLLITPALKITVGAVPSAWLNFALKMASKTVTIILIRLKILMRPCGTVAAIMCISSVLDDIFVQSYATLFTDGLQAAQKGQTVLYEVTPEGFAPVAMEVVT